MLALPIQTSLSGLSILGFDSNVAHAQSLNEVNLLSTTNMHAGMKGTMGDNTFSVNISGPIASDKNLIKSDNVINYHLDLSEVPDGVREKIELTSMQDGLVTVVFDPISLSLVSMDLQDSFEFLSESVQSGTMKALGFIDSILDNRFFKFFVDIQGVPEYLQAFDDFNELQHRPQHIPDYTGNLPVYVDNDTHTVSIDFTDELNSHVTESLEDTVLTVTNNFTESIKNIKIEIFPKVPFLNKLSVLVNDVYTILAEITYNINENILAPIAEGVLDATNLSNEIAIKGQINTTTTLQFNKTVGICEGTESVGHGTFPVTVRGLAANQVVTGSDLFYDLNAADDVTIIVLPHENCLSESIKGTTTNFGDRFDIGGIKGLDRFIDPGELILIEEEIEENNEAEKEFDRDATRDFRKDRKNAENNAGDVSRPEVDRGRGTTQQRTDSGKDSDDKTGDDTKAENDANGKVEDDTKVGEDDHEKERDPFKPRKDLSRNAGEPDKVTGDEDTPDINKSGKDAGKRTGDADRPQVDRDGSVGKKNRNTQQRTESPGDKADDAGKSGDDKEAKGDDDKGKADNDENADGDAQQAANDGDKAGDAQQAGDNDNKAEDDTQDAAGSNANIDIDMDDIEEGIGLLQRLLEIIMKIIEALTNK